ncbi:hypothetical protein BDB01DRAFT_846847 [Pilobolus umbonatus]|nr:hypothetical protein BDB01DRAFT_846847 [Pilobolus umbonatus]
MRISADIQQTTLLTLHDAITDSPVYRSTSLHFDEQIDLLEKWLESLSKHLKLYVEKLNKFNMETNTLCKNVIPSGIDDMMIDPNFTGAVIKSFSDALQTSLAFKTQLVSGLEEGFIAPLQQFIKIHLKEFKDFRKNHEKVLERYDNQLLKYVSQTKSKEASAVREEAFRLYEARKSYVRMSGQHVVRILHFRSLLEHFLVERFSLASGYHVNDLKGASESWCSVQSSIISWKQWLLDDKDTCNYQLHKLQSTRIVLENKFINNARPARDLEKYINNNSSQTTTSRHSRGYSSSENQSSHKWGYLFVKGSRNYWTRRWFFLYDGWFGLCNVNPSGRPKGAITLGDRVSVLLCDVKPTLDVDRRFCFEIICAHQAPFVLQAETEEDMLEWMSAIESSKILILQTEQVASRPTQLESDENSGNTNSEQLKVTTRATETELSYLKKVPRSESTYNSHSKERSEQVNLHRKSSIVMLSSSAENEQLSHSTSLTPLLVWEASRASNMSSSMSSSTALTASSVNPTQAFPSNIMNLDSPLSTNKPSVSSADLSLNNSNAANSSWGIPWALIPSMFQATSVDELPNEMVANPSPSNVPAPTDSEGHPVIWPTRIDDSNIPKVELIGYLSELDYCNRELRHLFGGVGTNEIVLTAFICSLKKKPLKDVVDTKEMDIPLSPMSSNIPIDNLEQEFASHLVNTVREPKSSYGYMYTGRAYITQDTFWFYSCIMMTCVNTIAIRLEDIDRVRIIRDTSVINDGTNSNLDIVIDLIDQSTAGSSLVFSTLMDDIEVIAERLKFAVSNAKQAKPASLQTTYDVIQSLSAAINRNNNNEVKLIVKSSPPPQPETPSLESSISFGSSSGSLLEPITSPIPSRSSDTKKKQKASRKFPAPLQPKSGALAAAMMAASVAGGAGFLDAGKDIQEESRHLLKNKKSKLNLVDNNESAISLPDSTHTVNNSKETDSSEVTTPVNNPYAPPKDFIKPNGLVSCGCDNHLDKLEAEIELPISAKQLYHILFDESNPDYQKIWYKKTKENKSRDLSMTSWAMEDGKKERTLKYILPVNNPMVKLKEAEVIEKQVIEKEDDYLSYVVLISTKTAQLPYADAFIPYLKYCITWINEDHCKLSCYIGVKFLKSLLVKGVVNKAAMKGMSESIATFLPVIKEEVAKLSHGDKKSGKDRAEEVTLKRIGTIKRLSSTIRTKTKLVTTSHWYDSVCSVFEMVKDIADSLSPSVKIVGILILALWMLYSCLRAGSHNKIADNMKTDNQSSAPSEVVSRAVYLRDIDEGLLSLKITPPYGHSESFRLFVDQKIINRSFSTNYQWHSSFHHQFGVDLLFNKERLAMLRHDALVLFQLVNELDAQLLESEYTNWLMDVRLKCREPDADYTQLHCEDVKRQLKLLSSVTI